MSERNRNRAEYDPELIERQHLTGCGIRLPSPGMRERNRSPSGATALEFTLERNSEGAFPMTKNEGEDTREKLSLATARQKPAELDQEEEEILAKAQSYLLIEAKRPMLWTVAGIREEKGEDGSRRWIIAVHVR